MNATLHLRLRHLEAKRPRRSSPWIMSVLTDAQLVDVEILARRAAAGSELTCEEGVRLGAALSIASPAGMVAQAAR